MTKTFLIGRTTKDIELKTTTTGTSIARFVLAVDRRRKEKEADFISCVAYAKNAELISQYVKKGNKIGVIGHIQTGQSEKNGQKVYTTEVIVDEVEFLEKKEATEITYTNESLPY